MATVKSAILNDADAITRGVRQMRAVCLGVPRTRALRERLERQRHERGRIRAALDPLTWGLP